MQISYNGSPEGPKLILFSCYKRDSEYRKALEVKVDTSGLCGFVHMLGSFEGLTAV